MKTIFTICCLIVATTQAQQHKITKFQTSDGIITWTNPDTNHYYGIEFSTNLYNRSWIRPYTPSALNLRSTNSQISVEIPDYMFEDFDSMYFHIVSSPELLRPKYYPVRIFHNVDATPDIWSLRAGALTLNDVSRVFLSGESIQGEFDLIPRELDSYGFKQWGSLSELLVFYTDNDYLFDMEPTLPAEFFIHMVSGSKTNTDSVLIYDYTTLNIFGDGQRN